METKTIPYSNKNNHSHIQNTVVSLLCASALGTYSTITCILLRYYAPYFLLHGKRTICHPLQKRCVLTKGRGIINQREDVMLRLWNRNQCSLCNSRAFVSAINGRLFIPFVSRIRVENKVWLILQQKS